MERDPHAFRILVIRSWIVDPDPIEESLRAAGIDAAITRVDFKAALVAALAHERFDAAIYDPATAGLSRADVEACLKGADRATPLIVVDDVTTLGESVCRLLARRAN